MGINLILMLSLIAVLFASGCTQETPDQALQEPNTTGEGQLPGNETGPDPGKEMTTPNEILGNETAGNGGAASSSSGGSSPTQQQEPGPPTVSITPAGFVPQTILVQANGTVRWVNNAGVLSWPASDKHPTHTVYPGSNVTKCGTSEEDEIFDACRGLAPGEIYEFAFNRTGIWTYHDHLNPLLIGAVVVQ